MIESVNNILDDAIERYRAGETPENLIPIFTDLCHQKAPKNGTAWSCLAWLYLLTGNSTAALKAAEKSIKLDPKQPQARVNLVLAMLEEGKTGVRQHIQIVQQFMNFDAQVKTDIEENIEDGLQRKPDWKNLEKVKNWLQGN